MRTLALAMAMVLGLSACTETPQAPVKASVPDTYQVRTDVSPDGPVEIAAVNPAYLNERNQRRRVAYTGNEAPGTIVVDPYARFLYHVLPGGEAMRFGIAVGKAGRGFSGTAAVQRKQAWPSWTPTANMIRTEPELYGPVRNGLPGGINNPLGSRALYLYRGGRDTMYRIHGTMDPSSIGRATSAGCIRLFNQDILDLYDEAPLGTRVRVRTPAESAALEGPLVETPEGYLLPAAQAASATVAQAGSASPGQPASPPMVPVRSPVESAVPGS